MAIDLVQVPVLVHFLFFVAYILMCMHAHVCICVYICANLKKYLKGCEGICEEHSL